MLPSVIPVIVVIAANSLAAKAQWAGASFDLDDFDSYIPDGKGIPADCICHPCEEKNQPPEEHLDLQLQYIVLALGLLGFLVWCYHTQSTKQPHKGKNHPLILTSTPEAPYQELAEATKDALRQLIDEVTKYNLSMPSHSVYNSYLPLGQLIPPSPEARLKRNLSYIAKPTVLAIYSYSNTEKAIARDYQAYRQLLSSPLRPTSIDHTALIMPKWRTLISEALYISITAQLPLNNERLESLYQLVSPDLIKKLSDACLQWCSYSAAGAVKVKLSESHTDTIALILSAILDNLLSPSNHKLELLKELKNAYTTPTINPTEAIDTTSSGIEESKAECDTNSYSSAGSTEKESAGSYYSSPRSRTLSESSTATDSNDTTSSTEEELSLKWLAQFCIGLINEAKSRGLTLWIPTLEAIESSLLSGTDIEFDLPETIPAATSSTSLPFPPTITSPAEENTPLEETPIIHHPSPATTTPLIKYNAHEVYKHLATESSTIMVSALLDSNTYPGNLWLGLTINWLHKWYNYVSSYCLGEHNAMPHTHNSTSARLFEDLQPLLGTLIEPEKSNTLNYITTPEYKQEALEQLKHLAERELNNKNDKAMAELWNDHFLTWFGYRSSVQQTIIDKTMHALEELIVLAYKGPSQPSQTHNVGASRNILETSTNAPSRQVTWQSYLATMHSTVSTLASATSNVASKCSAAVASILPNQQPQELKDIKSNTNWAELLKAYKIDRNKYYRGKVVALTK